MLENKLTQVLHSERGRYIGLALVASLVLIFLFVFFESFSVWRDDFHLSQTKALPVNIAVNNESQKKIAALPAEHLFGQAADASFLPITSLQLHLTGIVKVDKNNLSKAIISEAGAPGKVFSVGDEISSGIRISAIDDSGIVLEHAGRLEKLPLMRASLVFKEKPSLA